MLRDLAIAAIGGGVGALVTLAALLVAARYGIPILIKRVIRIR